VTDGQTDRQTELQWLRRGIAVPAVVRNKTLQSGVYCFTTCSDKQDATDDIQCYENVFGFTD